MNNYHQMAKVPKLFKININQVEQGGNQYNILRLTNRNDKKILLQ